MGKGGGEGDKNNDSAREGDGEDKGEDEVDGEGSSNSGLGSSSISYQNTAVVKVVSLTTVQTDVAAAVDGKEDAGGCVNSANFSTFVGTAMELRSDGIGYLTWTDNIAPQTATTCTIPGKVSANQTRGAFCPKSMCSTIEDCVVYMSVQHGYQSFLWLEDGVGDVQCWGLSSFNNDDKLINVAKNVSQATSEHHSGESDHSGGGGGGGGATFCDTTPKGTCGGVVCDNEGDGPCDCDPGPCCGGAAAACCELAPGRYGNANLGDCGSHMNNILTSSPCPANDQISYIKITGACSVKLFMHSGHPRERPADGREVWVLNGPGEFQASEGHFGDNTVSDATIDCTAAPFTSDACACSNEASTACGAFAPRNSPPVLGPVAEDAGDPSTWLSLWEQIYTDPSTWPTECGTVGTVVDYTIPPALPSAAGLMYRDDTHGFELLGGGVDIDLHADVVFNNATEGEARPRRQHVAKFDYKAGDTLELSTSPWVEIDSLSLCLDTVHVWPTFLQRFKASVEDTLCSKGAPWDVRVQQGCAEEPLLHPISVEVREPSMYGVSLHLSTVTLGYLDSEHYQGNHHNNEAWSDRTYTLVNIPEVLVGATLVQVPHHVPDGSRLHVETGLGSATVYLLVKTDDANNSNGYSGSLVGAGFGVVGSSGVASGVGFAWQKRVMAGEVAVGSNDTEVQTVVEEMSLFSIQIKQ